MKEKLIQYFTIILLLLWFLFSIITKAGSEISGIELILPVVAVIAAVFLCLYAIRNLGKTQPNKEQAGSEKASIPRSAKNLAKFIYLIVALCWMVLQTIDALSPTLKGIGDATHTVLAILVVLGLLNAFWPQTKKQG